MERKDVVGVGLVYSDHYGLVLATFAKRLRGKLSVELVKLLALRDELQLAANGGIEVADRWRVTRLWMFKGLTLPPLCRIML